MNQLKSFKILTSVSKSENSLRATILNLNRAFSQTSVLNTKKDNYRLLVVGGGSGGVAISAKFSRILGANNVAIVEPSEWHHYQPGWTLVAGGVKTVESFMKREENLIPKGVEWFKMKASLFDPDNNTVTLQDGKKIKYDYLVIATGMLVDFDGIKGLKEALQNDTHVVSMYSPETVKNVFNGIKNTSKGEAIFTFPKPPIKCPGAPQKIAYLADDYFRKQGLRNNINVSYYTTLPVIFGVKKYADSLMEIVKKRNINLKTLRNLIEIDWRNKTAIFEKLDAPGQIEKVQYTLLHACPPMKPIDEIKNSKLVDATGYVDLNKETLQHKKYSNVFGIGDCTNLPTSKTAAAIASQSRVLTRNLKNLIEKKDPNQEKYDGYTSCPLITQYGKLILAEFDYNGTPKETFPFDQGKESTLMYYLKKDFMPELYWHGLLTGYWEGPKSFLKLIGI